MSLDTFAALIDKSLLRREGDRYFMLETIGEYASERLDESWTPTRPGGTTRSAVLVSRVRPTLVHTDDAPQDEELAVREQANFRKALTWAARDGDAELGLRLATALGAFWVPRDPFEGMRWFDDLFARAADVPPDVRARALLAQGGLVFIAGEFDRGTQIYEQSLDEYRALGDEAGVAHVLHRLASSAMAKSDFARARMLAEESRTLHRRAKSRRGEGIALGTLADIEWRAGVNRDASFELAKQAAAIAREVGFPWWEATSLFNLCEWSIEMGGHSKLSCTAVRRSRSQCGSATACTLRTCWRCSRESLRRLVRPNERVSSGAPWRLRSGAAGSVSGTTSARRTPHLFSRTPARCSSTRVKRDRG